MPLSVGSNKPVLRCRPSNEGRLYFAATCLMISSKAASGPGTKGGAWLFGCGPISHDNLFYGSAMRSSNAWYAFPVSVRTPSTMLAYCTWFNRKYRSTKGKSRVVSSYSR